MAGRGQTAAWRQGFHRCLAAYDASVASHFAHTFGLVDTIVPNNSTILRIETAEGLFQEREQPEGFLSCWAWKPREDYLQVVTGQVERRQADPALRSLMYRFLQDGRLS